MPVETVLRAEESDQVDVGRDGPLVSAQQVDVGMSGSINPGLIREEPDTLAADQANAIVGRSTVNPGVDSPYVCTAGRLVGHGSRFACTRWRRIRWRRIR